MTSIQERQYTTADGKQFEEAEKQLAANRFDTYGPGRQRNADLIDEFFQKNRNLPVTVQNVYRAVEERKAEFVWHSSSAEAAWYETAQQNPELANQIANYLASTSGRPGAMVKDGDPLFENASLLFLELQSRREFVTPQTIAAAENRIANRPGKQLRRVPVPRKEMGTITEAARNAGTESMGRHLLGDLVKNPDGSFRSKTVTEQRQDAEAAEAAKANSQRATQLSASDQQWRRLALEACNYGNHSEQAQIQSVFKQKQQEGASPRETYEAVNQVRNALKRRREQMPA